MKKKDITDVIEIEKLSFNSQWSDHFYLQEISNKSSCVFMLKDITSNIEFHTEVAFVEVNVASEEYVAFAVSIAALITANVLAI